MKKLVSIGGLAVGIVLLLSAALFAATVPVAVKIGGLDNLSRPNRVAVDTAGNIIVSDTLYNAVVKYSPSGSIVGRIPLSSSPTAIKAADNGLLYIGMAKAIAVYSGATQVAAINGVVRPVAIDTTSTGRVYVLDAGAYNIKVFDASGALLSTMGSFATFGSDMRDLVVDEPNNEFYVLDRNQPTGTLDSSGNAVYVWRIQAFDLAGNFLRKFSSFGYATDGTLASPSSLAIDSQRRVYAADNMQDIIAVFDYQGGFLGTLFNNASPYRNPVDMAFRNNRLYFVSYMTNSATVLGIDNFANLTVAPSSVALKAQGNVVAGNKTIVLTNAGAGQLDWTATSDSAWLSVSKTAGSIAGGLGDQADVVIDPTGLAIGDYTGKITFAYNGGYVDVPVTLSVVAPPVLAVTPPAMALQADAGTVVTQQAGIGLNNDLSGKLTWAASSNSSWLTIAPSSGVSNAQTPAVVSVNATGMVPGVYSGLITVAANDAAGSTATISVALTVISSNRITVTSNRSDATYTITGPQSFNGTGATWSVSSVADGAYTITYSPVQGYRTPRSETKTITGGGSIAFSGMYSQIIQENVVATLAGSNDMTNVKILDMNGGTSSEFVAFGNVRGGLATAAADLNGDGLGEIAATVRYGKSRVGLFDQAGNLLAKFSAFSGMGSYEIVAKDLTGDGAAEVAVMKTTDAPSVRVFGFSNGAVADTGVYFNAFPAASNATVLMGSGDVDGDGRNELVTVQATAKQGALRIWSVDGTNGIGNWTVSMKKEISLPASGSALVAMAVRDVNGDGIDDVMLLRSDGSLTVLSSDGTVQSVKLAVDDAVDMKAGDVNGDGAIEIVVGLKNGDVAVFGLDGTAKKQMNIYNTRSGVRVTADLSNAQGVSK
ncbi:MAG: hypothetical protein M0024_11335 [Nitrospiraceae bacterium]|nr:hypothetical protein [Nitrospiraceae bacterium]